MLPIFMAESIRDIRAIRGSFLFLGVHSWLMISRGETLGLD